jgi:hypothetical protein
VPKQRAYSTLFIAENHAAMLPIQIFPSQSQRFTGESLFDFPIPFVSDHCYGVMPVPFIHFFQLLEMDWTLWSHLK